MVSRDHHRTDACFDTFFYCRFWLFPRRIHHRDHSEKYQMVLILCGQQMFFRNLPEGKCQHSKTFHWKFLILTLNLFFIFFCNLPYSIFCPDLVCQIQETVNRTFDDHPVFAVYPVKRRHHFPVTVKWNLIFSWITFSYFCSFHSIAASQIDQRCLCRISDFHSIFIGRIVT